MILQILKELLTITSRKLPNMGFFYWLTIIFNKYINNICIYCYTYADYNIASLLYIIFKVTLIFRVDKERIQLVGPDRACAEWLLRNGASVRWKGFTKYLDDYNSLSTAETRYYIQAVDATDSGITDVGFPYFGWYYNKVVTYYYNHFGLIASYLFYNLQKFADGCRYIDEIKLIHCVYINDKALPLLSIVKDTLTTLEIKDCKAVTDEGVRSLKNLKYVFYVVNNL